MSYRIMSFNVHNLSLNSATERLDNIANIIKNNGADIVAMQEVLGAGKIGGNIRLYYERSLLYRLGRHWRFCWCDPEVSAKNKPYMQDQRDEGYAFLWNSNKFELLKNKKGEILPTIDKGKNLLKRAPCYGRFKIKGLNAEIRLITTHIAFGKPKTKEGYTYDFDGGAIAFRQKEFKILAGEIYPRIAANRKDIGNNVSYTIILGDYNLNMNTENAEGAYLPETKNCFPIQPNLSVAIFDSKGEMLEKAEDGIHSSVICTVQHKRTTLKKEGIGLVNNYDHFSFNEKDSSLIKKCGILGEIDKMLISEDDYREYRENVSDHLPIYIDLDFKTKE